MKNLLSAVIIAFVVTFSINICSAEYYSRSVTELNKMIGTWYDSKGNVALTIGSDYSINGCKVLAFYLNNEYTPIFSINRQRFTLAESMTDTESKKFIWIIIQCRQSINQLLIITK